MRTTLPLLLLLLAGCMRPASPAPAAGTSRGANDTSAAIHVVTEKVPAVERVFGLPSDFSGDLTDEEEQTVPEALRNVYLVDRVKQISARQLKQELQHKPLVAEEQHNGIRYVALQSDVCVEYPHGVQGLMLVIERYAITNQ